MIHITSVHGNTQWLDGGSMFGNAPRAVWQKWTEIDSQGRIPLACRCLLIEVNGLKILCESGIGAFFEPKLAERFGVQDPSRHILLENLEALGHSPESIDYVILSHLHFDHAGGLLPTYTEIEKGNTDLVFPKAQFLVGRTAWDRALNAHFRDRASFIPLINQQLEQSGRLEIIENLEPPKELKPFITFFESHGHTPGQMHTMVTTKNRSLIFAGDLIPGVPWVHLPITMGYDRFPEKLIEEKQQLYSEFEDKELSIFFTHDPKVAMGVLSKNERGHYTVLEQTADFTHQAF